MATAVLVISAIGSAVAQRKASKAQRKQNEIQNRIAATRRARDIRRSIAQRRIRTADIQAAGFQLGVAGGTAQVGAQAGVVSDTAGAIGAANQQFTGQQAISSLSDRISSLQSTAQTFQSVGAIAGQFSGAQGAQNTAAITDLVGF